MSMIGFAARSGTAVEPYVLDAPRGAAERALGCPPASAWNVAGQAGSGSTTVIFG